VSSRGDLKTIVLQRDDPRFSSDGLFNLGSALSFAQVLPPGVYVAMNGTAFRWDQVRKNTKTGYFESTSHTFHVTRGHEGHEGGTESA
jgi:L-asparaginase